MTFEEHIQKGFNAGYQLEKHNPELASTLKKGFTDKEHPYVQGFMAGSQEYSKEVVKEKSSPLSKYSLDKKKSSPSPSQERDGMDFER